MSKATLVLGESGTGKSASLRNMDPVETLLIQALQKPLPFKNSEWQPFNPESNPKGNIIVNDRSVDIIGIMRATKRPIIVIDDFQYVMANEFMRRSDEKGYEKFTEIGRHAWDILNMANQLPPEKRVYLLSHTAVDDLGRTKMKTIGKMLDEKITVEGMITMVFRTVVRDGGYYLQTHNSGSDTVKTPMDMFREDLIDNDLKKVDERICEYYDIDGA